MRNSNSISIKLRKGYRDLSKKDFNKSITSHIERIYESSDAFNTNTIQHFSNSAYYKMVDEICYNKITDFENYEEIFDSFSNYKYTLYEDVIKMLGKRYKNDDLLLNRTIDLSIENIIRYNVYNQIRPLDTVNNPWNISTEMINELNVLYYFSDYESNRSSKTSNTESELSKNLLIDVFARGVTKDFSHGSIRDTFALKDLLLKEMDQKKYTSHEPIKYQKIIDYFRNDLSIPELELTDSNIKNWIIKPLKNSVSIGSNSKGYFIIKDEEDLINSYSSHLKNYQGYINTLNRHKSLAIEQGWSAENFDKHNQS